ncbi:hypothetical protein N9E21_01850 [Candidatus Poseidoniaceae archaeon]|nr:hypothetical protein [Candidatus Poseidoniaceae archaeon]
MAKKSSNVNSRKSTIRYEMTRDFVANYTAKFIPEFSDEDELKMLEIFNIPDLKTCIVTGQKVAKTGGDHLFEVRGYYKKTEKVGIEQKWNRLPVTTDENKRYKKYDFVDENHKKYTKNIGYQKLTEDELEMCDKQKKDLYNNIQNWVDYCDNRGVKLCVKMPTNAEKHMNTAIDEAFTILEKGIEKMVNSVGN